MMEESVVTAPDLDVLFELFNDDISGDVEKEMMESLSETDNIDDTSSESSGSTGHSGHSTGSSSSPPFSQISTYCPAPSSVVFAPNPLSSFSTNNDADCAAPSKKRSKTEEKLIRNRESANKSRLKRKHEKAQLEETVAELRERVRVLEMENNALLTDNTTLSQHNFFLQGMLKKQQEGSKPQEGSSCEQSLSTSNSHISAIGGISMLCVVFSVSCLNNYLPSSWQGITSGDNSEYWDNESSSLSGRVLLAVDDDVSNIALETGHTRHMFQYALLLGAMFLYYLYHQYNDAFQKKSSRVLPS
jgi:hypothetical protein